MRRIMSCSMTVVLLVAFIMGSMKIVGAAEKFEIRLGNDNCWGSLAGDRCCHA